MPYISKEGDRREKLRNGEPAQNAGELNYQIFYYVKHNEKDLLQLELWNAVQEFVDKFLGEKRNYQKYNDVTGCLVRCYKEIKRRLNVDVKKVFWSIIESYDDEIAQYEDTKIKENGDVE